MVDVRKTREIETRDKEVRYVYKPTSSLPDPNPEPGMAFRYLATHILGQPDPTNISRKMRDGWTPVKAADHPELMIEGHEKSGNVEIGGLMLCKIAEEKAKAYDDYYARQAQNQMDSVDNHFMKDNDPRMRKFAERNSTVTRGSNL